MNDYVPLLEALDGHFEQSLNELPPLLRERVLRDFPMPWSKLSSEERRHLALKHDEQYDDRASLKLQYLLQQCNVAKPAQQIEDMLERQLALEQEIDELDMITVASISDRELKKIKKAEAKQEIDHIELQLSQARCDYLESDDSAAPSSPCQSVYAAQIISNFRVIRDEDQNKKWWEPKLADADRYHLLECRVGAGRKGRGAKTLWRPDLIAGWLIDRHEKNLDGMNLSDASAALRKLPDCADIADSLFPPEK